MWRTGRVAAYLGVLNHGGGGKGQHDDLGGGGQKAQLRVESVVDDLLAAHAVILHNVGP